MDRRQFVKRASGLVVAAPYVIRPSALEAAFLAAGTNQNPPSPPGITIPLTKTDPIFANNVAGSGGPFVSGTQANKNWDDSPGYPSGDACWAWNVFGATANLLIKQCMMDNREGPRVGGGSTTGSVITFDQCYINVVGKTSDHADGIQAFANQTGTGVATLNVTNSCIQCYDAASAVAKYGAGFIGSDILQWADGFEGIINFNNVVLLGPGQSWMTNIGADGGTTVVNWQNIYVVGAQATAGNSLQFCTAGGGSNTINTWQNVFRATIVGGQIVVGAAIPNVGVPTPGC